MRKLLVMIMVVVLIGSAGQAATSMDWSSATAVGAGLPPDILDGNGDAIAQNSDWYMQLYDTAAAWNFGGDRTAGELFTSNDAFSLMEGVASVGIPEIYPWASGKTVGTRLFNNSDPSLATAYALSSLTKTVPVLSGTSGPGGDPTDIEYNIGTIGQQDWVPEPTTTMLALAGICTLIYRRRRMRK